MYILNELGASVSLYNIQEADELTTLEGLKQYGSFIADPTDATLKTFLLKFRSLHTFTYFLKLQILTVESLAFNSLQYFKHEKFSLHRHKGENRTKGVA